MVGMGFALAALALVVALLWIKVGFLEMSAKERTPATVSAAIEDLRTALAQVHATNRREFGSIWKRLGLSRRPSADEQAQEVGAELGKEDALTAMLALQSASTPK